MYKIRGNEARIQGGIVEENEGDANGYECYDYSKWENQLREHKKASCT